MTEETTEESVRRSRWRYWLTGDDGMDADVWGPAPSRIDSIRSRLRNGWRVRRSLLALWRDGRGVPRHSSDCDVFWGQGAGCTCSTPETRPVSLIDVVHGVVPDQPLSGADDG